MTDMSNSNDTTIFSVVTQHGTSREVRSVEFGTWEEARDYAESTNFMLDGTMMPNIDFDEIGDGFGEYWGSFWHLDNKYAAVFGPAYES